MVDGLVSHGVFFDFTKTTTFIHHYYADSFSHLVDVVCGHKKKKVMKRTYHMF